jgi:murein DD-endopeptidase MepM/ murein hydrolase activator NlpD
MIAWLKKLLSDILALFLKKDVEETPHIEQLNPKKDGGSTEKKLFHFPVKYIAITEYYSGKHLGVDFGWNADRGYPADQPIYAAFGGTVVKVWNFNDAGLTIKIRFDDEVEKLSWYAQYKHLSAADVHEGQTVQRGDKIGNMGGSGGYAPHLHFDILRCPLGHVYDQTGGQREIYSYNPLAFLFATTENVLSYDKDCTWGVQFE